MTKFSSNRPVKSTLTADQSSVKRALRVQNEFFRSLHSVTVLRSAARSYIRYHISEWLDGLT